MLRESGEWSATAIASCRSFVIRSSSSRSIIQHSLRYLFRWRGWDRAWLLGYVQYYCVAPHIFFCVGCCSVHVKDVRLPFLSCLNLCNTSSCCWLPYINFCCCGIVLRPLSHTPATETVCSMQLEITLKIRNEHEHILPIWYDNICLLRTANG